MICQANHMHVQVSKPPYVNQTLLETAGFDTSRQSRLYSTSGLNLNKIAAGAACGERLNDENYLQATGAIRGSPSLMKPRTPMCRMDLLNRS
jgi:hypothetical protein